MTESLPPKCHRDSVPCHPFSMAMAPGIPLLADSHCVFRSSSLSVSKPKLQLHVKSPHYSLKPSLSTSSQHKHQSAKETCHGCFELGLGHLFWVAQSTDNGPQGEESVEILSPRLLLKIITIKERRTLGGQTLCFSVYYKHV